MERIITNDIKFTQTNKKDIENELDEIRIWLRKEHVQKSKTLSISDIMVNHAVGYNRGKRIYLQLQSEGVIDDNGILFNQKIDL